MTKLRYLKGNLLKAPEAVIGHGCNAQGTMGSGIAKQIQDKYPGAFDAYMRHHEIHGLKVGTVIPWTSPKRVVLNMVTQKFYGRDPDVVYVNYDGVRRCMQFIEETAERHQTAQVGAFHTYPTIALPRIGGGLANGDWDRISAIIEAEIRSIDVVIYDRK